MRPIHTVCLIFLLALAAPYGAWAQPPAHDIGTTQNAQEVLSDPAGKFVQDLGNRALAVVADSALTQEQRNQKYHQILRESFDLPAIGRFVLGRAWASLTPEQQKEYMQLFEATIVKTYGDRLNFATGENFQVRAVRRETAQDAVVSSAVTHPDASPPTLIDWRVRQQGERLAVVDVIVEGVSLSITQRQEYAAIIQRDAGKADGLLALMHQRLQEPQPSPEEAPTGN